MKILEEKIDNGKSKTSVVKFGKKKYIRIADEKGVAWLREKTKHQVKAVEFENLELKFSKESPIHFVPMKSDNNPKKYTFYLSVKDKKRHMIPVIEDFLLEKKIQRQISKLSNSKLQAVKIIKENTGWGLKYSKSYADWFFERQSSLKL